MTRLGNLGSLLGLLFVVQTLADPNATSTTETGKSLPQQPECARVQDYFVRLKIGHANLVPKNKVHGEYQFLATMYRPVETMLHFNHVCFIHIVCVYILAVKSLRRLSTRSELTRQTIDN